MIERPLKIAVLVKQFTPTGGSERYALEVARRLAVRGHAIDVYAREADEAQLEGLQFIRVPDRFSFSSVLRLYSFAKDTARMLAGSRYDIIHTHERGAMPQDVSTLHSFSYRGSGYSEYPWWKKIMQVYCSPRSWLHLMLEADQMKAPHLAAVSSTIRDDAWKYYGRTQHISVITPGVDTERFHPQKRLENRTAMRAAAGIGEQELVVLFVGSEFKRKGLDRLLPHILPGMRLFVVGRGERLAYYQAFARRLQNENRITFTGLVDDVTSYYAMADVVVLPSRSEAFGMSILEGMSCGLPVVASTNAGVSSLLCNGMNGYRVSTADELAGVLGRMKNAEHRNTLGLEARKTAEQHGWDDKACQYEELFFNILLARKA